MNLGCLYLLLAVFPALLPAEPQKWALLVGIDQYESKDISSLAYASHDVTAFADALTDALIAGFPNENVFLMTNSSTDRDRPKAVNIILRLDGLAQVIEPEDTFVFYFAGHAITSNGEPYLFGIDTEPTTEETIQQTAIPLKRLQQRLGKIKARHLLFICDSCRNDPQKGRGDKDNLLREEQVRGLMVMPRRVSPEIPRVMATLFACSLDERAYEWPEKSHGVFSYYCWKGSGARLLMPRAA